MVADRLQEWCVKALVEQRGDVRANDLGEGRRLGEVFVLTVADIALLYSILRHRS